MVRILFLHGYAQTPEEISSKSRQIQRALPNVEFVFPRGAVELVSFDGDMDDRSRRAHNSTTRFAWNFPEEDMSTHLVNLETTFCHLLPILEEQGPFDGIMGFSQGAAAAAALASILERRTIDIAHPAFKFAVLFCGARPSNDSFDLIYRDIKTPSLHLIGRQDVMVPQTRSLELASAFESAKILHHPGNHFIPQGQAYTTSIADFVSNNLSPSPSQPCATPSAVLLVKDSAMRPTQKRREVSARPGPSVLRLTRKSSFVRARSITC